MKNLARGVSSLIQEGLQLGAAPNLGDYIPCIAPVVLQGFTKRMKSVHKTFDDFLDKIVEEHLQSMDMEKEEPRNFLLLCWDSWGLKNLSTELDTSTSKPYYIYNGQRIRPGVYVGIL